MNNRYSPGNALSRLTAAACFTLITFCAIGQTNLSSAYFSNKSVQEQTQTVTQNFSARLLGNIVDGQDVVRVMIQNSEDAQVSVELFNMQGARIATKYVQSGEVDFSTAGLGAGMYVVKCTKKDKTIVLKLMK